MHNSYMAQSYRKRRIVVFVLSLIFFGVVIIINTPQPTNPNAGVKTETSASKTGLALRALELLAIKGRAPKTNYSREQFGKDWVKINGCDTRNIILNRDLTDVVVNDKCEVISGKLDDPYTGKIIQFKRGSDTSSDVQIDHVVALSDAWQKGAQQFTSNIRTVFANDPLELLAVDGSANQQKSDGDAATWLPPNKSFRCQYVARQIAVKQKYKLWVTQAEHDAIFGILNKCDGQLLPSP